MNWRNLILTGLCVGTSALAHDLIVDKKVNGKEADDITAFPFTANYTLQICNIANDPSEVLAVNDTLLGSTCTSNFGPVPFTLAVGQCVTANCTRVINSQAECTGGTGGSGGTITNTFSATFNEGTAKDNAILNCPGIEPPFSCTGGPYVLTGNPSTLNIFNVAAGTLTPVAHLPHLINGIGINPADGLIYGVTQGAFSPSHLVRISADGSYSDLGAVPGLTGTWPAGGFLQDGTLLLQDSTLDRLARVNVTTKTATVTALPGVIEIRDLAVNPTNGLVYAYDQQGNRLITMDPTTGAPTTLVTGIPPGNTDFISGSAFFDQSGNFYLYGSNQNSQGAITQNRFYRVDLATGVLTQLAVGPAVTDSDGASCATASTVDAPSGGSREHGFYKLRPGALTQCLSTGAVSLGDGLTVSKPNEALGYLWSAPAASPASSLRLQVARELLTARCNERLFGHALLAAEEALQPSSSVETLSAQLTALRAVNASGKSFPLPAGLDAQVSTPAAALGMAWKPALK